MKRGIFLNEPLDTTCLVQFDAAVAAGIIDLGAKQRGFGSHAPMVFEKFAQVSVSKAVTVHDQYRIATQTLAGKSNSAGGTERPRLHDRFNRKITKRCRVML